MKQQGNQCMPFDADFSSTKHTILKQQIYNHHWLHEPTKTSEAPLAQEPNKYKKKNRTGFLHLWSLCKVYKFCFVSDKTINEQMFSNIVKFSD